MKTKIRHDQREEADCLQSISKTEKNREIERQRNSRINIRRKRTIKNKKERAKKIATWSKSRRVDLSVMLLHLSYFSLLSLLPLGLHSFCLPFIFVPPSLRAEDRDEVSCPYLGRPSVMDSPLLFPPLFSIRAFCASFLCLQRVFRPNRKPSMIDACSIHNSRSERGKGGKEREGREGEGEERKK